ncbi:MAG: hypothetical protein GY801_05115 [bacterium]|nr:hypothetical protein [bacterium]
MTEGMFGMMSKMPTWDHLNTSTHRHARKQRAKARFKKKRSQPKRWYNNADGTDLYPRALLSWLPSVKVCGGSSLVARYKGG